MTSIPGASGGVRAARWTSARYLRGGCLAVRMAVLTAALGVLGACSGSVSVRPGQAQPAQAQPAQARVAAPSAQVVAESLDFTLPATGAEYSAGAQFMGEVLSLRDQVTSACMARSGFRVPATSAAAYAAYYAGSTQLPDLARITRMGNFGPVTPLEPPPVSVPAGQRQALNADMARCQAAADKPLAAFPRASAPLTKLWVKSVFKIEASAPVQQAWVGAKSCFEQAGIPAADAGSFETFFPYEGSLSLKADTSQAGVLRVDEHWAPIFVRCAAPVVKVEEPLQSARRALFIQQHYQQVRHLETVADQIVVQYQHEVISAGPGSA